MAKTFEYKYSLIAAANVSNIWVFENLLTTDTYSYKIVFVGVFFLIGIFLIDLKSTRIRFNSRLHSKYVVYVLLV